MNNVKEKFSFNIDNDVSKKNVFLHKSILNKIRDNLRDIYDMLLRRHYYKFFLRNFFKNQNYNIDLTLPSKGFSNTARKKKLNSISQIKDKDILIIGCGNGNDFLEWIKFKPKSITGIDILNYSKSWNNIKDYFSKNKIQIEIKFEQKNITEIESHKIYDFIVSDAVFEHLKDFSFAIKKCNSLLKTSGVMYASYGPLWYCHGGDHFSNRHDVKQGFNHLLISQEEYMNFFRENVTNLDNEIKLHGSAGIFVKENLFSKLTGNQYMNEYSKNNLYSEFTVVEFCPISFEMIKSDKILCKKLLNSTKFRDLENFYLKSQIVFLKKLNS